jgi:flagellar protein FliJ
LSVVKSRDREAAVRLKRFQVEEQERQVGQIETMIEEFSRMVADLDQEIAAEHRRTGVEDMSDFRYSIYARAARQRRTNLAASIADLESQLDVARAALDLSRAELAQEEERLERESAAGRDAATRAAG